MAYSLCMQGHSHRDGSIAWKHADLSWCHQSRPPWLACVASTYAVVVLPFGTKPKREKRSCKQGHHSNIPTALTSKTRTRLLAACMEDVSVHTYLGLKDPGCAVQALRSVAVACSMKHQFQRNCPSTFKVPGCACQLPTCIAGFLWSKRL